MLETRSRSSADLEAWAQSKGGLRPAARELGLHHNILSRWIKGDQLPRDDGPTSKAWIEERTGVAVEGWDVLVQVEAGQRQSVVAPPTAPPANGRIHSPAPNGGNGAAKRPAATRVAEPETPRASKPPRRATPAPATVAELQARLREIPFELASLRQEVVDGSTTVSAAETLRRLLADEAKTLSAAVTAAGIASVAEVEQLEALVLSVTSGCEACRSRVEAALQEIRKA